MGSSENGCKSTSVCVTSPLECFTALGDSSLALFVSTSDSVGYKELKPLVALHITTGIPHEVVFLLTLVQVKKHLFHQLSHPHPHNRTMRFLNILPHVHHLCPPHPETLEENNRIIAVTYHKRWCFCLVRRHWWRWRYHYFTIGVLLYVTLQKEEKKHC